MSDRHFVWLHRVEPHACDLSAFDGFEDDYRLFDGESLAEQWPSGVYFEMNRDHPDDKRLVDSLFNTDSLLVVSERLRSFLEGWPIAHAEFLPVEIRDHKRKRVDKPYHILNLAHHHDCLDATASYAEASMVPGEYDRVEGLVLRNEEAIADEPLFRLARFGVPTIVKRELAEAIDAEGFSGVRWGELADFEKKLW